MLCEPHPFCQWIQDKEVGAVHRLIQNHCSDQPHSSKSPSIFLLFGFQVCNYQLVHLFKTHTCQQLSPYSFFWVPKINDMLPYMLSLSGQQTNYGAAVDKYLIPNQASYSKHGRLEFHTLWSKSWQLPLALYPFVLRILAEIYTCRWDHFRWISLESFNYYPLLYCLQRDINSTLEQFILKKGVYLY